MKGTIGHSGAKKIQAMDLPGLKNNAVHTGKGETFVVQAKKCIPTPTTR
jgi:hypothetical protein